MSISSTFLYRFLEDAWDLLPTEDRNLFSTYWSAQIQIAGNLEQKTLEADLSKEIATVPVFLTERWNRYVMDEETCDLFQQTDALTLVGTSSTALSRETVFPETLTLSTPNGQIPFEETIQLFDDSVRQLRYGDIITGAFSVSIIGYETNRTGGQITAINTLQLTGAFRDTRAGMVLRVINAVPDTPRNTYTIKSVTNENQIVIEGSFGVASATSVEFQVADPLVEYTPNRDYAVNLAEGTIQALPDGRIPPDQLLRVQYRHRTYAEGIDYELDTVRRTVRRITTGAIASGATVAASYTYNATPTLQLTGDAGSAVGSVFSDSSKDFSNLLSDRTLTITSGPNEGTYTVNSILSPTSLQIVENFPVDQTTDVPYSINAFPHGVRVSRNVAAIPVLQDLADDPTYFTRENVDYRVENGILALRSPFRVSGLGPTADRARQAWAEVTKIDRETPYRNFGVLIDFFRANSEEYKLALQGLWYTFWTGSTPGNLQRGLHILLGLPFAREAGTVTRVDALLAEIDVTEPRGSFITYTIPSGLDPQVAVGDEVARFDILTTGVQIIDRNNEPGFVTNRLGLAGVTQFLTSNATLGSGDTDQAKALLLLENHLFLPQVLVEAVTANVNVTELVTFLENMKPKNTHYVFAFSSEDEDEEVLILEDISDPSIDLDLTTTVVANQINRSAAEDNFLIQSSSALPTISLIPVSRNTASTPPGGTQATGNFRDLTIDFVDLNVDRGDIIQINEGPLKGVYDVLQRISSDLLSISIPDADFVAQTDVSYVILPEEQKLDNDAINVRGEHFIKSGADFPAPTTLNTKTDIDLASTSLKNGEVTGFLLLDIGNTGNEVQAITDANVLLNEFDVASTPGTTTRDHQIASCSLQRTDNMGPTITDVYAI